jgi:predicted transcriptional regulator
MAKGLKKRRAPRMRTLHRSEVTEAELSVLETLWSDGRAPIRSIADALYPGGGTSEYATVQKLLERLVAKGCVHKHRLSGRHEFEATIARDELIALELQATADRLCGGSITPLLTRLVESEQISERDRARLRALIEGMEATPKSDRRRS